MTLRGLPLAKFCRKHWCLALALSALIPQELLLCFKFSSALLASGRYGTKLTSCSSTGLGHVNFDARALCEESRNHSEGYSSADRDARGGIVKFLNARKPRRCHQCLVPRDSLRRCTRCRYAHYCCGDDQKAAWAAHAPECKRIARFKEQNKQVRDFSNPGEHSAGTRFVPRVLEP